MIHCADEALGLHGKVKSLGHSYISVRAEIFPYFLSLDERIKVRVSDIFPPHSNSLPPWETVSQ
jgi:hypothetical protein